MDEREARLRDTLGEIERLIADAREKDDPVQPWLEQFAVELKSSLPDPAAAGPPLARWMRSHPARALRAQAHVALSALRILRD
ncbi:MAG TPA: hypothetical protein VEW04_07250 [Allosphingosinicella sp.]|nr:hypothetical protein [Allosphingosinicella sp.]